MSDGSNSNKEFVEQLRLQELYGQRNEDGSDPYTYTDPEDGTVYDWDHDKKAWFPKVWTFHCLSLFTDPDLLLKICRCLSLLLSVNLGHVIVFCLL